MLLSMWQHWPGGELLRHPPPCAIATLVANINVIAIINFFITASPFGLDTLDAGYFTPNVQGQGRFIAASPVPPG